jgi:hypothetical protein
MNEGLPTTNNTQDIEQSSDEEKLNVRFLKQKELVEWRLAQKKERVESARHKLESLKLELGSEDVENNPILRNAYSTLLIREHALLHEKDTEEFLRKPEQTDIEYRFDVMDNWPKKVAECIPEELPLRFHGCPIYTARAILSSGEISSSVDRLGFETSYDVSGDVSVSMAENVRITTDSYTDLSAENLCIPGGCVFVLLPKDQMDADAGNSLLMGNVSITAEPDRLVSIVTTPENIARVSEWANAAGIPTDKVVDFSSFLSQFPTPTDKYKV